MIEICISRGENKYLVKSPKNSTFVILHFYHAVKMYN
jgi:hypothetical protein